jgi:hypothetical protein
MNRMQKIAWAIVLSTAMAFVVSLVAVGLAYPHVGFPKALIGFSFMGLAGLGGIAPAFIKKDRGPVRTDERDLLFQKRAAIAGFGTAYLIFGLASMTPFFVLGSGATISVQWLPGIFMAAGICHFFAYSVAILSQYGWTSKGEKP